MTEADLDRMMRKVLFDAIALEEKDADDSETAFQPSRHHTRQMQRMLKNPLHWARNRNRGALSKTARWVAVILLFITDEEYIMSLSNNKYMDRYSGLKLDAFEKEMFRITKAGGWHQQ